jgi:hypothetical protein
MPADAGRATGALAKLVRAASVLAAIGFIALLTFGLLKSSPDATIDDALARLEAPPPPASISRS